MADNIKQTMLKAEKLAVKIKKKIKRSDLDFNVQVSVSSQDPGTIYYALQITPVAEGIAPMTFVKKDAEEFIKSIEAQLDKLDEQVIEKAYHESQIKHAERTIKFHQERIDDIEKEAEDGDEQAE